MDKYFIKRLSCPSCNSLNKRLILSIPYSNPELKDYLINFYSNQGGIEYSYISENLNYTLEECQNCSLIFQTEIPNDFLMKKLYEEWLDPDKIYNLYEKNYPLDYYLNYVKQIYWIISQFNTNPNNLKFFDFGMGWGNWALIAKSFGCNVFGSELSEIRIKYALSNGINIVSWVEIPDYQFDFINTDQIFEHLPEPLEILKYLSKSLKPEGLIRISVPDGYNAKEIIKIMDWKAPRESKTSLHIITPLEHINCFNFDSTLKLAELAGLERVFMPLRPQILIDYEKNINQELKELKSKTLSILKKMIKSLIKKNIPLETYHAKNTNLYFRKKLNNTNL